MTLTVTVVEYLNKKTDMKEVCTSIHYIILCKPKNAMHTCVVLWIVIVGFWSNLFVIIFYSHNLLQNIFEPTGPYHNHNFKTQSSTTPSKAFKQESFKIQLLLQGHFNAKHNIIYDFNIVCKLLSHFPASVELLQLLWL